MVKINGFLKCLPAKTISWQPEVVHKSNRTLHTLDQSDGPLHDVDQLNGVIFC